MIAFRIKHHAYTGIERKQIAFVLARFAQKYAIFQIFDLTYTRIVDVI